MLLHEDAFLWVSFWRLSEARMWSDNGLPMAISYTEMLAYCTLHGIVEYDERMEFDYVMREMDRAWRKEVMSNRG